MYCVGPFGLCISPLFCDGYISVGIAGMAQFVVCAFSKKNHSLNAVDLMHWELFVCDELSKCRKETSSSADREDRQ